MPMVNSRMGCLLACMVTLLMFETATVEADVRGNEYAGGFVTNLGFPAVCTLSFGTDGLLTQWEYGVLFGGVYTGPYTEIDVGGITYWRSVVADESPNGYATFSGFAVFDRFTTFHNQNLDQGITVDGLLIRTGTVATGKGRP